MRTVTCVIILFFIFFLTDSALPATWCKAIYPYSKEANDGKFQKQLSLCRNADNLFISIHTKYENAQHLLNASIANFCDLNRQIIVSSPEKANLYFSAVCVFKRHSLRVN